MKVSIAFHVEAPLSFIRKHHRYLQVWFLVVCVFWGPREARPAAGVDSGADADAVSCLGESSRDDPELQNIPVDQGTEDIFWAYERAKARWRRRNDFKPTRRVRRAIKRKGKGNGKGWGKAAHNFRAIMSDEIARETFVGFGECKGEGKGKVRASGMGLGRSRNPLGPDGVRLQCHECDSEDHPVRDSPRRRQQPGLALFLNAYSQSSSSSSSTPFTIHDQSGPPGLSDQLAATGVHQVWMVRGASAGDAGGHSSGYHPFQSAGTWPGGRRSPIAAASRPAIPGSDGWSPGWPSGGPRGWPWG